MKTGNAGKGFKNSSKWQRWKISLKLAALAKILFLAGNQFHRKNPNNFKKNLTTQ